jgi:hypothetical protein
VVTEGGALPNKIDLAKIAAGGGGAPRPRVAAPGANPAAPAPGAPAAPKPTGPGLVKTFE